MRLLTRMLRDVAYYLLYCFRTQLFAIHPYVAARDWFCAVILDFTAFVVGLNCVSWAGRDEQMIGGYGGLIIVCLSIGSPPPCRTGVIAIGQGRELHGKTRCEDMRYGSNSVLQLALQSRAFAIHHGDSFPFYIMGGCSEILMTAHSAFYLTLAYYLWRVDCFRMTDPFMDCRKAYFATQV